MMERKTDPAVVTVGLSMGSIQDGMGNLMITFNEVMSRLLQIARLTILAGPLIIFSFYIHSVDLCSWFLRLGVVYGVTGLMGFIVMPEQMYTGLGLGALRWVFEFVYPEIAFRHNGTIEASERGPVPALSCMRLGGLDHLNVRMRWHGTSRYLHITHEGWASTSDQNLAVTLVMQQVTRNGKQVPDTYTFRIDHPTSQWHQAYLSFQAINHLHFGGWLMACRDIGKACPYKVVQDTACPGGACKLLCAWSSAPPPTHRYCTGFYIAESGSQGYVAHCPDWDAAMLELVVT